MTHRTKVAALSALMLASIASLLTPPVHAQAVAVKGHSCNGTFDASSDRGYVVAGSIEDAARIDGFDFSVTPAAAGASGVAQNQIGWNLAQATRLQKAWPAAARVR